jgi:hypothetical protein
MTIDNPGGRLSRSELRELNRLLARFAEHDLDQWATWQLQTTYGPVYVVISNELAPGDAPENYTTIWPLPPHLRNDSADDRASASGG